MAKDKEPDDDKDEERNDQTSGALTANALHPPKFDEHNK